MKENNSSKSWLWVVIIIVLALVVWLVASNGTSLTNDTPDAPATFSELADSSFVRGIVINVDGEDYYLDGPTDAENGGKDIPGHAWVDLGDGELSGVHYNTGPFGESSWWSSDAQDGELLYTVDAVIDEWTEEKATDYAEEGFIHYHELVRVSDGELHPSKVAWLRHIAETSFTLDGGPGAPNPPYEHSVTPGVDLKFPPNGMNPYPSEG